MNLALARVVLFGEEMLRVGIVSLAKWSISGINRILKIRWIDSLRVFKVPVTNEYLTLSINNVSFLVHGVIDCEII